MKKDLLKLKKNPPKLKYVVRMNLEGRYRYFDTRTQSEITPAEYRRRKKIQKGVILSRIKPTKKKKDRVEKQKFETVEGRDYISDINFDLSFGNELDLYNITREFVESKISTLRRIKNIPDYSFFVGWNGGLVCGLNLIPTNFRVGEFDLGELLVNGFDRTIGEEVLSKIREMYLRMMATSDGIKFETIFLKTVQLSIRKER